MNQVAVFIDTRRPEMKNITQLSKSTRVPRTKEVFPGFILRLVQHLGRFARAYVAPEVRHHVRYPADAHRCQTGGLMRRRH